MTTTTKKTKQCCGTSVGAIITDEAGRMLMVTRGWHPIGIAPVAGHARDVHSSVLDALVAEVREEVGLTVTGHQQVWEGRLDNLCSNMPASPAGHYWWVHDVTASGTVSAAPVETRGADWYTPDQVQALAERTLDHAHSGLAAADQPVASLEAVWIELLHQAGRIRVRDFDLEAARRLYTTPPATYWRG
jgi:ADP-ribose pyrophosphatase YjhB (NUDIX family)